jgi:hypothetical protein
MTGMEQEPTKSPIVCLASGSPTLGREKRTKPWSLFRLCFSLQKSGAEIAHHQ